ncbi:MAG: cobalamin-dependent protein, partial [Weeksellaceae bacterium]|nr:cobalamin-dependent protein [Weeksellaceae bacterium]
MPDTKEIQEFDLRKDVYKPKNHIRIVTAASLFDGHDVAINIMRRIIQATGVEVIHLGHDRSVEEVVDTAIQEDAQGIAMTSYQGGHNEYFKYMFDLLNEKGAGHIKIFGGGGGVILPTEIKSLMGYGIVKIYSPDDGRDLGFQGMINEMVMASDFPTGNQLTHEMVEKLSEKDNHHIAQAISAFENNMAKYTDLYAIVKKKAEQNLVPILGITGTGGAGKSSLIDELVRRYLLDFPDKTIGIVSVDPTKRKTGGALLGDRIRMNSINNPRVFMRSMATRQANASVSQHVAPALDVMKAAGYDLVILETSGIGQSGAEVMEFADVPLYVMTPEYGAASQLEKIDMLDYAEIVAINKFDKKGAEDALRDVKKQFQRNHQIFDKAYEEMPVYPSRASMFNDAGTNQLYKAVMDKINEFSGGKFESKLKFEKPTKEMLESVIPAKRVRYLSEIV